MIGMLRGKIVWKGGDVLLIDVGGVGYEVHCAERTLAALPPRGEAAVIYTDLLVREDLLRLYGFLSLAEREWHRLLVTVQGVGAKGALAILGTLGPEGVSRAIALGDYAAIKAAPGIGPKLAQRIVNELKDKAPAVMAMAAEAVATGEDEAARAQGEARGEDGEDGGESPRTEKEPPGRDRKTTTRKAGGKAADAQAERAARRVRAQGEALSALVNLGYGQGEAAAAVAAALEESESDDTATLIRAALGKLAPQTR